MTIYINFTMLRVHKVCVKSLRGSSSKYIHLPTHPSNRKQRFSDRAKNKQCKAYQSWINSLAVQKAMIIKYRIHKKVAVKWYGPR